MGFEIRPSPVPSVQHVIDFVDLKGKPLRERLIDLEGSISRVHESIGQRDPRWALGFQKAVEIAKDIVFAWERENGLIAMGDLPEVKSVMLDLQDTDSPHLRKRKLMGKISELKLFQDHLSLERREVENRLMGFDVAIDEYQEKMDDLKRQIVVLDKVLGEKTDGN